MLKNALLTSCLSSIVFVYSPSAHIPNAGLGHGCASTPANARPPHLSSLVYITQSKDKYIPPQV